LRWEYKDSQATPWQYLTACGGVVITWVIGIAETVVELNKRLQDAQKTYTRIQSLSLNNFI